jgi:lysozyme family protein
MKKLVIANMYRAKNKSSFFAIHQALTRLSEFDIEFHILWDDLEYKDEWTDKIDKLNCKLISYTKSQLDQYCLDYGVPQNFINKFVNFKAIYFILHAHYFKKNNV